MIDEKKDEIDKKRYITRDENDKKKQTKINKSFPPKRTRHIPAHF